MENPQHPARPARVVVGVDGSPSARVALRTSLIAAAGRGARLDVVTAVAMPSAWLVWTRGAPIQLPDAEAVRADIERRVRALVDEARRELIGVPGVADLDVRLVLVDGAVVPTLLDAADGAELLVVGSRGSTSVPDALLGSVSLHALSHAPCPVLIAHRAPQVGRAGGRIVVGVDGSPARGQPSPRPSTRRCAAEPRWKRWPPSRCRTTGPT